MIRIG